MGLFSAGGKRRRRDSGSGWPAGYIAAGAEGWRESGVGGAVRAGKVSWPSAATWKEGRSQGVPRKKSGSWGWRRCPHLPTMGSA